MFNFNKRRSTLYCVRKQKLEFIIKYFLPKMFKILCWTTRVRVYCIMHAITKIKFNLKWLICLEHLLEFEPYLQPSSPNFKYSVTKYFLTLSIYINTSWSQSRNMFIMLIQAQVYIITLTLSHEYFRNRKQETNYHILSVSQESFALCIMIFCMHIAHFLVNIVSLDKQRRPVVTKL